MFAAYIATVLTSFLLVVLLIPVIIRWAKATGVMDVPTDDRRAHTAPVPRLGGVAIFIATGVVMTLWLAWDPFGAGYQGSLAPILPGVLIGAGIVFVTGLADDLVGVSPRVKLVAQSLATGAVLAFGLQIDSIGLTPGGGVLVIPSVVSLALLSLWIVGVTNAFNLIDGIDGLAGTFALIGIAGCVAADVILNGPSYLPLSLAVFGSVVAFLRFNTNPAKIFLGDSGSMTLGFLLAVRVVVGAKDSNGTLYPIVPLAVLAFPLADTFIAMARRWLRGHPFSRADGRHIHHQLLGLGFTVRQTVDLLGLIFASVAALGIAITFAPIRLTAALILAAGVVGFLLVVYGLRGLRYAEFVELAGSVVSVMRNARRVVQDKLRASDIAAAIDRASTIDEVRELLGELSGSSRIIDLEVVELADGLHSHGPPGQQLSRYDALPVRIDYAFAVVSPSGPVREFALRVWTERPMPGVHAVGERLAARVGPALERWLTVHEAQLERLSDDVVPLVSKRRSGPVSPA